MAETFKPGDTVRLKSGSPRMTVTEVGNDTLLDKPMVWCVWFVGAKKDADTFPPEALELSGSS